MVMTGAPPGTLEVPARHDRYWCLLPNPSLPFPPIGEEAEARTRTTFRIPIELRMNSQLYAAAGRLPPAVRIFLITLGILALELALIRWASSQIRLVAYFTNLVLLAAFLGMGLGIRLGLRWPRLSDFALPLLFVLSAILGFSEELGLVHLVFPDQSISLWGAESSFGWWIFLRAVLVLLLLFWLIAGAFAALAAPLGPLFDQGNPLGAYSADLLGSLCGIFAMAMLAWLGTPPWVWLGVALLPVLILRPRALAFIAIAAIVLVGHHSAGDAIFSPYNRIDIEKFAHSQIDSRAGELVLSVNRDYHQNVLDLSVADPGQGPESPGRGFVRRIYELPYAAATRKGGALVVGAGTGNDVAAALRSGFERVVSVDIDARIIQIGRDRHPEQPYDDPRVEAVVEDARAYFERYPDERFDVVSFGLLDSHAMFSAMSSLRLDNFVYTVEGVRAAYAHVAPGGLLSISFSTFAGAWIEQRMAGIVAAATGSVPILIQHGYNHGTTFLVGDPAALERAARDWARFSPGVASVNPRIRIATDDWPFLYVRPDTFPTAYLAILGLIALSAVLAIRGAFGADTFKRGRFDPVMFLLGAGFMLLQTRLVTQLSLLFGSTWVVNTCVFGGILTMALLANLVISRWRSLNIAGPFVCLLLSLLLPIFVDAGFLNQYPMAVRWTAAAVLYALPVFFAGMIFSTLLARAASPGAALGANLCGAVFGGLLEYLSMILGLRAVAMLALVIYLLAGLYARRDPRRVPAG